MTVVKLVPGDTLIVVSDIWQETAMGRRAAEVCLSYSYEEVSEFLGQKPVVTKKPRSKGVHFSRLVSLGLGSLRRGTWPTGAIIDRNVVFENVVNAFSALNSEDHLNVTLKARQSLKKLLYSKPTYLTINQQTYLQAMIRDLDNALNQSA